LEIPWATFVPGGKERLRRQLALYSWTSIHKANSLKKTYFKTD
jgi:hypothetical protein